jgi:hypothetical protein
MEWAYFSLFLPLMLTTFLDMISKANISTHCKVERRRQSSWILWNPMKSWWALFCFKHPRLGVVEIRNLEIPMDADQKKKKSLYKKFSLFS